MKTLSAADFLTWAEKHGLTLDPSYPQSAVLTFGDGSSEARFWCVPPAPEERPYFLATFLALMRDWTSCFVWRHLGRWPDRAHTDPDRPNDIVEREILKGLGLPLGTADVVQFTRPESGALITLLFSTTIFGWCVADDFYVVPNHARCILQTDHHDVIHVQFRSAEDVAPWVAEMAGRDFPLPDELPDETFKRPNWMR